MELDGTLGFLGYGNMGAAIFEGLLRKQAVTAGRVIVYDPLPERAAEAERLGATAARSPEDLARASDTLVLAVKPQMMDEALAALGRELKSGARVISIAAGISIAYLAARLGAEARIIRVMPNTPALVGAGAAGIALGGNCTGEDARVARAMFEAVGMAEVVPEEAIDAVTALSGSGPAYFFYMAECLVKAAAAEGLEEAAATRLAAQTLLGAGKLLESSGEGAAVLRRKVTSKGGTTEAALNRLSENGFEELICAGVHAAAERSRQLGA